MTADKNKQQIFLNLPFSFLFQILRQRKKRGYCIILIILNHVLSGKMWTSSVLEKLLSFDMPNIPLKLT